MKNHLANNGQRFQLYKSKQSQDTYSYYSYISRSSKYFDIFGANNFNGIRNYIIKRNSRMKINSHEAKK